MPIFVVAYEYTADSAALRDEHRPRHRGFLTEIADAERPGAVVTLLASGPFTNEPAALLVLSAPDEAAVGRLLDDDPFATVGAIRRRTVREWTQVIGPWVG